MDNFVIYNLEEENGDTDAIDNKIIFQWMEAEKLCKKIIICTNKTLSYVLGMLQAIPQVSPIIIAESGSIIYENGKIRIMPIADMINEELRRVREKLEREFSGIWFQDNTVGVMGYHNDIRVIREFLKKERLEQFRITWDKNSICIMPNEIDFDKAIDLIREKA